MGVVWRKTAIVLICAQLLCFPNIRNGRSLGGLFPRIRPLLAHNGDGDRRPPKIPPRRPGRVAAPVGSPANPSPTPNASAIDGNSENSQ